MFEGEKKGTLYFSIPERFIGAQNGGWQKVECPPFLLFPCLATA